MKKKWAHHTRQTHNSNKLKNIKATILIKQIIKACGLSHKWNIMWSDCEETPGSVSCDYVVSLKGSITPLFPPTSELGFTLAGFCSASLIWFCIFSSAASTPLSATKIGEREMWINLDLSIVRIQINN